MSHLDEQRQAHEDLIKDGRMVIVRRETKGQYDPATGKKPAGAITDWHLPAVFSEYTQRDIDGTNVRVGDARVILSAYGGPADLLTTDRIIDGSRTWTVVNAGRTAPGEVVIVWRPQLRS